MVNKMLDAIKSWIPLIVALVAFTLGNTYGQARVQEQWTKADNDALIAYKARAEQALKEKDDEIKRLNADLADLSKSRSDIVRKLDTYKARERTLAQCHDDRKRMADVAVGLDDFAQRLVTRTRSMIK
mgnify:CR=1 FL=1